MDSITTQTVAENGDRRQLAHRWAWVGGGVFLAIAVFNLSIWFPVSQALGSDDRNGGFDLHAYRSLLVHPRDITLDLVAVDAAATVDLTRGLFQAAEALKDREFGKVTLARGSKAVFVISGADFKQLGESVAAGENPVYLLRTLPEKLMLPDGRRAFGSWSGGWLGVLSGQMEDLNVFGPAWVNGEPPTPPTGH
ncbi:hypothetical protein [Brevundimonas sp. UBA2416]|uniref:hypothetical protein n=1 Tax=Brevundimonas sp. UBA2416 TaxID=1946124 RepID=UPI0025B91098|nr:hypothetical protein [Brevundimonas sp. UBA2416]